MKVSYTTETKKTILQGSDFYNFASCGSDCFYFARRRSDFYYIARWGSFFYDFASRGSFFYFSVNNISKEAPQN